MIRVKYRDSLLWADYVGQRLTRHGTEDSQIGDMAAWGSAFRAIEQEMLRQHPEKTKVIL